MPSGKNYWYTDVINDMNFITPLLGFRPAHVLMTLQWTSAQDVLRIVNVSSQLNYKIIYKHCTHIGSYVKRPPIIRLPNPEEDPQKNYIESKNNAVCRLCTTYYAHRVSTYL